MALSVFGTTSIGLPSAFNKEISQPRSDRSEKESHVLATQSLVSSTDDSSPPPPDLPTWDDIPVNNKPEGLRTSFNYELRPGSRVEGKALFATWLDQDGTATYNPDSRLDPYIRPPAEIVERRKRRRQDRSEDHSDKAKRQKTSTWQRGRIEGKRLPVTLRFHTEQGQDTLAAYGTALDNWPKSAWRPQNEDIDWGSWWNPISSSADEESHVSSCERAERRTRTALNTGEVAAAVNIADLVGHPVARGCKGCLDVGHRCPLLDEGSRYPCDTCLQDDVDCELLREPAEKRACLNCGRKRICCSYRKVCSDHNQPCEYCANEGLKCIAGPASGRTRTGPALTSAVPKRVGAIHKKLISCKQCRIAKRWCSRIRDKAAITCDECAKNGDTCMFESTRRTKARARCVNQLLAQPKFPVQTNVRAWYKVQKTLFIKAKLPHPIDLNYVGDEPCHWCQDMGYGMLGVGPALKVEVIDSSDGSGYIELDGGYFVAGCGSSRMCDECTFERLAIAACLKHDVQDIKPIDGMDVNNFDFDCVDDYLMPGRAATAPFSWCSICQNPAFHACCKQFDIGSASLDGVEGTELQEGCGLRLCEPCATTLAHESGGDLEALVEGIGSLYNGEACLRADVDMILPAGELVRRIGGS